MNPCPMRKDIREPYRILASFSNKLEVSVSAENGRRKAPCRPELLALPVKRRGNGRRHDGDCGVGVGEPPPAPCSGPSEQGRAMLLD